MSEVPNALQSPSPEARERLIEAVEPASLLVVIEQRMSTVLRRGETADDIFQEALLHAWRDRRNFEWRGVKSFRSWLLTIIDHRIRFRRGSELHAKRLERALGSDAAADEACSPDGPRGSEPDPAHPES